MYESYLTEFKGNPGIDGEKLSSLGVPPRVPADYLEFLKQFDGGEGFIGQEHIVLYQAESLARINKTHRVSEYVPDIYIFGSNGSSEALAFDFRSTPSTYVLIPFLLDYKDVLELAPSLEGLFSRIASVGLIRK